MRSALEEYVNSELIEVPRLVNETAAKMLASVAGIPPRRATLNNYIIDTASVPSFGSVAEIDAPNKDKIHTRRVFKQDGADEVELMARFGELPDFRPYLLRVCDKDFMTSDNILSAGEELTRVRRSLRGDMASLVDVAFKTIENPANGSSSIKIACTYLGGDVCSRAEISTGYGDKSADRNLLLIALAAGLEAARDMVAKMAKAVIDGKVAA